MVDRKQNLLRVETEARGILGDHASEWMVKPSRLLDGLAPADLAGSQEGARVVLIEFERARMPVRASVRKKKAPADFNA